MVTKKETNKPHLISFDLDGTLVDATYTTWVWEVGIPELYAQKHNLSLAKAIAKVTADYESVGDKSLIWYDIKYWFEHYGLSGDWRSLLEKHRRRIRLFPEVKEVIRVLARRYELIVTSNAAREFVEMEVKETGIARYFRRFFSATSDFGQVKKTPQFYQQICEILETTPAQMVHVGDHYEFDYLVPKALGIEAYYLNRNGKNPEDAYTVKNLKEFAGLLE